MLLGFLEIIGHRLAVVDEILQIVADSHLALNSAQTFQELYCLFFISGAPGPHLASLHHEGQFLLVGLDLLVGLLYLRVGEFGLQIQIALLGDISRSDSDIDHLSRLVTDGVQTGFQIVVDIALENDALVAYPQFFQMFRIAALAEG